MRKNVAKSMEKVTLRKMDQIVTVTLFIFWFSKFQNFYDSR